MAVYVVIFTWFADKGTEWHSCLEGYSRGIEEGKQIYLTAMEGHREVVVEREVVVGLGSAEFEKNVVEMDVVVVVVVFVEK